MLAKLQEQSLCLAPPKRVRIRDLEAGTFLNLDILTSFRDAEGSPKLFPRLPTLGHFA